LTSVKLNNPSNFAVIQLGVGINKPGLGKSNRQPVQIKSSDAKSGNWHAPQSLG